MSVLDALRPAKSSDRKRRRLSNVAAWSLSLAAHLTLVVGATAIVWSVSRPDFEAAPLVRFNDPGFAPDATPAPETPVESVQIRVDALPELPDITDSAAPVRLEIVTTESVLIPAAPDVELPNAPVSPEIRADFAGLGASAARDIVYVVDASASMITAFRDVKSELLRSVSRLHPTQRFQVVLIQENRDTGAPITVADVPAGLGRPMLVDATSRAKRELDAWIDHVSVRGRERTSLWAALDTALRLEPDAIFVLAQIGVGDDLDMTIEEILVRLEERNPRDAQTGARAVAIKTIQFLHPDPAKTLEQIGRAHGGGDEGFTFLTLDTLVERLGEDL